MHRGDDIGVFPDINQILADKAPRQIDGAVSVYVDSDRFFKNPGGFSQKGLQGLRAVGVLLAVAELIKVFLFLVLPLLAIAAALEVWVTPWVIAQVW